MNSLSSQNNQYPEIHSDKILILDFGSQYTQLIARRVREFGVYCEIHASDCDSEFVVGYNPRGIILSGGPETVTDESAPVAPDAVFTLGVPVLGICYGMQTTVAQLGGRVDAASHREFGFAQVRARGHSGLLRDIEDHTTPEGYGMLDVWMSHGDRVTELPAGHLAVQTWKSMSLFQVEICLVIYRTGSSSFGGVAICFVSTLSTVIEFETTLALVQWSRAARLEGSQVIGS